MRGWIILVVADFTAKNFCLPLSVYACVCVCVCVCNVMTSLIFNLSRITWHRRRRRRSCSLPADCHSHDRRMMNLFLDFVPHFATPSPQLGPHSALIYDDK